MRRLPVFLFFTYLLFTTSAFVYSQHPSQETVNAVTDERMQQIEHKQTEIDNQVAAVLKEMSGMRSSIDRFTGIGVGLGIALTTLQAVHIVILMVKGKKGPTNGL